MSTAAPPAAVLVGECDVRLWGLDGAERLARQLRAAGVDTFLAPGAQPPSDGSVVLFRTDHLFEARTITDLVQRPDVLLATAQPDAAGPVVAAHVRTPQLAAARAVVAGTADAARLPGATVRTPDTLSSSFVKNLHKTARPIVLPARERDAAALERHLFDGSYKGVTDLVTKWVWPAPARAVTRFCAHRGISPNAVTGVSLLLVVLVTLLFARGWLGTGLALAWLMTFLDTVDGKLARVTVTSTPIGHYFDHSIDAVHPPIWYFAWAWGVALDPAAFWALTPLMTALLVAYLGGRLVESVFEHVVGGGSMFTWRPFDSYFRLVMARRNPNLLILTASWVAGVPAAGFLAVVAWTVLSTLVLLVRLGQSVYVRGRDGALRSWLGDVDPTRGNLPAGARPFVADLAPVRHLVQ